MLFEETVYSLLIHLAFLGPSPSMQLYDSMVRMFIGKSKSYAGMSWCRWRIHTGQPLKRITLSLCHGLEAYREFASSNITSFHGTLEQRDCKLYQHIQELRGALF